MQLYIFLLNLEIDIFLFSLPMKIIASIFFEQELLYCLNGPAGMHNPFPNIIPLSIVKKRYVFLLNNFVNHRP